jgi:hypothetical protein
MTVLKADYAINGEDVITHTQRIMGSGIVITPPHELKQPSRWYYRVHEVTKHEFGIVTCGIKSTTNFIKFFKISSFKSVATDITGEI